MSVKQKYYNIYLRLLSSSAKIVIVFIFILSIKNSLSQTITHPSSGISNSTITCGTTYHYYDSGGLSSNYGNGTSGTLTISPSDAAQYIQIYFESFDIETCGGASCTCDWLKVYDGLTTSDPLIGKYCSGNMPPMYITSTTGSLTFEFYADGGTTAAGWEAVVNCSSTPTNPSTIVQGQNANETINCGTTYEYFDSGGFGSYGVSENSTTTINPSSAGQYVQIDFTSGIFDVEGCSCDCDYMTIYDGNSTTASVIGKFCNINAPGVITSSTGSLTIVFHSDSGTELDGWKVPVTCTNIPGVNQITQPINGNSTSTILCGNTYDYYDSGGQLNKYSALESGILTIEPSVAGQYVEVTFNSFNVEANGSGCFDYINIYDGSNTAILIGTFCNSSPPTTITSSTGALTFQFHSDSGTNYDGWEASVSCSNTPGSNPAILIHPTTGSTSNINVVCGSSYTYYDSGGQLNNYSSDEDGAITFNPSVSGQFVSINFNSFDTEDCGAECCDYISIYDGIDALAPLIGTYCTSNTPTTITSSTGSLTIAFSSDAGTVKVGWDATISCSNTAGFNPIVQPKSGTSNITIDCAETYEYYDSGAVGRNYGDDENSLLTICPGSAGEYISIEINDFKMENEQDYLYVFDGDDPSANILALYTGTVSSGTTVTASSNNSSGCLSFRSLSDVGTTEFGWDATITCEKTPSVPITPPSNDCTGAISVCNNENLTGGTLGPGNQELPDAWSSCLGLSTNPGEYQSNWYVFSSTTDGTIGFLLTPDAPTDYDWAIWGPYASLECPAFTNDVPLRCSAASLANSGTGGETGLQAGAGDTNEPSAGDGYLEPLNVLADEVYIMMLDNWDANDNPFELSWQLTGASLDCTPLPVTIAAFETFCNGNQTNIEWTTVSEINNNFFIVEKSTDAIHFKEVGKIFGKGNSNRTNHYLFTDTEQNIGITYYRLLQVDYDGSVEYHQAISSNCAGNSLSEIKVRQLSTKNMLVEVDIPNGKYQLSVYDNSGKLVVNKKIEVLKNTQEYSLINSSFTSGLYLVLIQNQNNKYTSKVIME